MLLPPPEPPRLPDPSPETDSSFIRALLNVLRLYFNRLQSTLQALLGDRGGTFIRTYYGEFWSTATQTAVAANTAYPITFDTTAIASGIELTTSSQITVKANGVYAITLSLQLANADSQLQRVSVWFAVRGAARSNSNSRYSVPSSHGGSPGQLATEIVVFDTLYAGDVLECYWSTSNTLAVIEYTGPDTAPVRPATPSAILTVNLLSAVPPT